MPSVNQRWMIILLWLILLSISTLAESGCFLYPESSLYCSDVERQSAEEECSLFEGCSIDQTFNPGRTCQDISAFPECQQVLCKSSCQQEFVGKCGAGGLPANEREEWCSPGCCRFTSRDQNHCSYTSNKWFCEVKVRNNVISEFNFDQELLEPECNQQCILANAAGEDVTVGLLLENVSADSSFSISSSSPRTPSLVPSHRSNVSPEQLLSGPSGAVLGVILLLIALLSLFYYWHQKKTHGSFFSGSSFLSEEKEERSFHPFLPFLFSPQSRARMEQSKLNHAHKVKHQQREGFLREAGMKTTAVASAEFKKLQQLVKSHEHQKKFSPDLGRSQVQRLQRRLSPSPRKPVGLPSPSNADPQSILSKLRKLAKK